MLATKKPSMYMLGMDMQKLFADRYDPETGEINESVEAQITALSGTAENKCIATVSWIKKLEADRREIEFYRQEIMKREKAYDEAIQKSMDNLKRDMENCRITEVSCPLFTIKVKQNPWSTDIIDESQLPERFMVTREVVKTETKADKNAIKEEVIRTGIQVPGASVMRKTRLEISTDKL